MDLQLILQDLKDCSCGREHTVDLKAVEIGSGLVHTVGEILVNNGFPRDLLVVTDEPALAASAGILESLDASGIQYELKVFESLRVAEMDAVELLEGLCAPHKGVLSIGTGSVNDICRLAAFRKDKPFAIFATAPSMDGFASDSAPITKNNFKISYPARQPRIIIADTKILAAAPSELKAAGFGDMIAKKIAMVDWRVSHLLTGEYYCEKVAALVRKAVDQIVSLADKVTAEDEEAAGAIMEALCFTGIAMQLVRLTRPASGAEHIISHFWEVKKLEDGIISDFHGKKVGVATLIVNNIYNKLAQYKEVEVVPDMTDWDKVKQVYGPNLTEEMMKMNEPPVTEEFDNHLIAEHWQEICDIIHEELMSDEELYSLMLRAGAATSVEEIAVSDELCRLGVKYHSYMRHRVTIMRLLPLFKPKAWWIK